ncbi:hypothetical protein FSP39_020895 [Pinctada imbricata]|uniref:PAX-interacting protein 1 n=1 Tax=Pinctada imbricata TaxID=66713 RepID=A0AA88YP87_PINIB|nr:hypothetical protein FSP39_020895 [Pinctada imbricata]
MTSNPSQSFAFSAPVRPSVEYAASGILPRKTESASWKLSKEGLPDHSPMENTNAQAVLHIQMYATATPVVDTPTHYSVLDLLTKYGAKRDTYLSEMVSHVIADDPTQDEYSEAKELFDLPVVSSQWVYLSVRCKKQLPISQFALEGLPLSGVVATCSNLEKDDLLTLWSMITYNGGHCQSSLDQTCTHLITTSLQGAKYELALKHEENIKIVCPDWVTACIDGETKVDELPFHPRFIKPPTPTPPPTPSPPPQPTTPIVPAAPDVPPLALLQQPQMQQQPLLPPPHIFQHPFMAEQTRPQDMGIGHMPRLPLPHMPMEQPRMPGQGQVVRPMRKQGTKQGAPAQQPKQVIAQQLAAAVLERRSLHEERNPFSGPVLPSAKQALARMGVRPGMPYQAHQNPSMERPPYPIPGFPPHMGIPPPGMQFMGTPDIQHMPEMMGQKNPRTLRNITNGADPLAPISNVRPSANRINQMLGLDVQMPQRPPPPKYHLPGGPHPHPPKVGQQPAVTQYVGHDPSDNVPPELCLMGCVFYVSDYTKILAPESIDGWKKVIEQYGGHVDPAYSNRVTHLLCANQHSDVFHIALKDQRRVVTAFWLNDVLVKKKMVPPWQSLHLPIIYNEEKPCSNQIICVTNFEGEDRLRVKQMINAIGAKYTGYMTHTNSALISNKPDGKKYEKAKDWRIPVVNVQWLSDLVIGHLDALKLPVNSKYTALGHKEQFNLDTSKVPHLMVGWQAPLKIPKDVWKKYLPMHKNRANIMEEQENINILKADTAPPPLKKLRLDVDDTTVIASPTQYKILFTGYPRGLVTKFQPIVQQLGGVMTDNPVLCTHVIAPALTRTIKFFVAINVCKHIITKQWLEDSMSFNRFLDEKPYYLKDTIAEKEMQCNLQESLKRAQAKKLFEGLTVYISPSVTPSVPELTRIVECAGGKVAKKRQGLKLLSNFNDFGHCQDVVITCEKDLHLFRNMIARKIPLYNSEFILMGVLRQELNYTDFQIDVH